MTASKTSGWRKKKFALWYPPRLHPAPPEERPAGRNHPEILVLVEPSPRSREHEDGLPRVAVDFQLHLPVQVPAPPPVVLDVHGCFPFSTGVSISVAG